MSRRNRINTTIRLLIVSDFFLFLSIGLLAPIFGIFILENIENKIEVIGYAVACYWLTRVVAVIPLSRLMDKIKGEYDEYYFMLLGTLLIATIPLLYVFSSQIWHVYALQIANGLAYSMAVPAWRILFTNHVDRRIVGFEWSIEDVGVGVATAFSAAAGSYMAARFGFPLLFCLISFFGVLSVLVLLLLGKNKKHMLRRLLKNKSKRAPLKLDTVK